MMVERTYALFFGGFWRSKSVSKIPPNGEERSWLAACGIKAESASRYPTMFPAVLELCRRVAKFSYVPETKPFRPLKDFLLQ